MDSLEHVQGCTLDRSDVLFKSLDLCGQRLDACLARRAETEEMIKDIEEMVNKIKRRAVPSENFAPKQRLERPLGNCYWRI